MESKNKRIKSDIPLDWLEFVLNNKIKRCKCGLLKAKTFKKCPHGERKYARV